MHFIIDMKFQITYFLLSLSFFFSTVGAHAEVNRKTCDWLLGQVTLQKETQVEFFTQPIDVQLTSANSSSLHQIPGWIADYPDFKKVHEFSQTLGPTDVAIIKRSLMNKTVRMVVTRNGIYNIHVRKPGSINKLLSRLGWKSPAKTTVSPSTNDNSGIQFFFKDLQGDLSQTLMPEPFTWLVAPLALISNATYRFFRRPRFKGAVFTFSPEVYELFVEKLKSGEQFELNSQDFGEVTKKNLTILGSNLGRWIDMGSTASLLFILYIIGAAVGG